MRTSVVIVNYNVRDLVLTCLRTLLQFHEKEDLEIIVVDNDSRDGSCAAIRTAFPEVVLIENNFNAGFPHANNQGFQAATGDYIFMLNPDTEFVEPVIGKLKSFLSENPSYGIVAPKLLNTDKSLQQSVWRFPSVASVFCESFHLGGFLKKKNYADRDKNVSFDIESCSGAAMLFPKELLKTLHGLDETMFWIEDVEFCYRATEAGKKIRYLSNAAVLHHIGQSAKKNYNISLSNQIFNKIKFFAKHGNLFESLCVKILSYAQVSYKIVVFGLLSPFKTIWRRKFRAYVYTFPKMFHPPKGIA